MSSRAIQRNGSIFNFLYSDTPIPTLLPDEGSVIFPNSVADVYSSHPDDTSQLSINHIIYYVDTHKFRIITTPTTQNKFLIIWEVNINACNSNKLPTFSIVVKTTDGTEITSIPNSGCRTRDTLHGSSLLTLPTPSLDLGRVDYYLSLVNRSGAECYYSLDTIYITSILITSIDY